MLSDAHLLFTGDRAPRAHALATLAFEEIGKAFICIVPLLPNTSGYFGIRSEGDFWKAWNSHADKLAWARAYLSLLVVLQPQLVILYSLALVVASAGAFLMVVAPS